MNKMLTAIRENKRCAASFWAERSDENIIQNLELNDCKTVKEALEYALKFVAFDEETKRVHPNYTRPKSKN